MTPTTLVIVLCGLLMAGLWLTRPRPFKVTCADPCPRADLYCNLTAGHRGDHERWGVNGDQPIATWQR